MHEFRIKQIEMGYSVALASAMRGSRAGFVRVELKRNLDFVRSHCSSEVQQLYNDALAWLQGTPITASR
ncbi:hypothetical protein [Rhizobium sp. M1]|uniref:hypothetical protein n=1 Tax=Rhizobium sp. M1 TaxID=2035453 RepID=UPI00114335DF|nr:hypothetical protein [Rhizobium sp. M1]